MRVGFSPAVQPVSCGSRPQFGMIEIQPKDLVADPTGIQRVRLVPDPLPAGDQDTYGGIDVRYSPAFINVVGPQITENRNGDKFVPVAGSQDVQDLSQQLAAGELDLGVQAGVAELIGQALETREGLTINRSEKIPSPFKEADLAAWTDQRIDDGTVKAFMKAATMRQEADKSLVFEAKA